MKLILHTLLMLLLLANGHVYGETEETLSHPTPETARPDNAAHETPQRDQDIEIPDVFVHRMGHESDTFQSKFLNMLFILALLIGFMLLASWALKRMMRTKVTQLNTGSSIKILETRYLSPRATLYLLDVDGHKLLIAESPTTVTHLKGLGEDS